MARKKRKDKSTPSKNSSSDESYICDNCGGKVDPTRNICMRCGAFYNPLKKFFEEKFFKEQNAYSGWFSEATSFKGMSNKQIEYNDGLIHLEKMHLDKAINYYDREVEKNPNDYVSWNNLGVANMGLKHRKNAIQCYRIAVDIKSDYYIGLYNIGALYYECQQYEKAIKFFDKAIKANPKCGEAHWDKHLANEQLGHLEFGFTMEAMKKGINIMRAQMNRSSALVDLGNGNDAILGYYYLSLKNQNQLREYHNEAIKNYEKGDLAETMNILKKCVKLNPDDPIAWKLIGKTYIKLKNYEEAQRSFERSLKIDRNSMECWLALGSLYGIQGRLDEGIHCYEQMLRINPFDPMALKAYDTIVGEKFRRLRDSGRNDEALALLDKLIADNPPDVTALWVEKGVVYFHLKNFKEANKCFNRALVEDPKNTYAWLNKGGISLVQQQFLDAYECYTEVLKIDPSNERAIKGAASALANTREMRSREEELQKFQEEINKFPKEAIDLMEKGSEYFKSKKLNEALRCFEEGLKINAEFPDLWYFKGNLHISLQEYQKAIDCFEEVVKLKPKNSLMMVDVWINKGVCHRKLNELNKALDCYKEASKLDSTIIEIWLNMGNIYLQLNDPAKAIEYYNKAIDLGAEQGSSATLARNSKGHALIELKMYPEALDVFNRVLEFNPVLPSAWVGKGSAHYRMGRFNEAIECFNRAIKIEPDFVAAWGQKADLLFDIKEFKGALTCYNEVMRRNPKALTEIARERIEMLKKMI